MAELLKKFETLIIIALVVMMMCAVLLATIELGVIIITEVMRPPIGLLNLSELVEVFGFFMMVLIGVELLETLKSYITKKAIHVEVVLLVAIIAVARKVIILDYKSVTFEMMVGIASVTIALAAGYFLVKKGLRIKNEDGGRITTSANP
ncbi:MAG: phosphate-starvation-inducible E-like protein [Chitinivibrionales bacterium]|nr:phosphate-starvation-inducible E-like protein [Chitinivibrionales bacterium]